MKIWRWPGPTIAIVPIARMIKALFGRKVSELFYHYLKYIGHYRPHYAAYNPLSYFKEAREIRGPISLNIKTWTHENISQNLWLLK